MRWTVRAGDRRGFALPLALAVMVALSILGVTALQVALSDFQANRGARLASRALFAAEAGAQRTVARWSSSPFSSLAPGDSASTGWVDLPDGSRYLSVVMRVDDGSRGTPMYRVLTEGRPSRAVTARRQIVTMVTGGGAGDLCCSGGLTIDGRVRIRGANRPRGHRGRWDPPPQVDGRDHTPTAWSPYCPAQDPGTAGVAVGNARDIRLQRGASVRGVPPIDVDRSIDQGIVQQIGSSTYDELAALASITFNGNTRLRAPLLPRARAGECDTSDSHNWGAPENPGSVCWDYLPIVHATGNLRLDGGGQGQGILLVDGDLQLRGNLNYHGIIVVKGTLLLRDQSVVTGGVIVGNRANGRGNSRILHDTLIRYSSCAVARSAAGLGGADFLAGRYWFEIP